MTRSIARGRGLFATAKLLVAKFCNTPKLGYSSIESTFFCSDYIQARRLLGTRTGTDCSAVARGPREVSGFLCDSHNVRGCTNTSSRDWFAALGGGET